MPLLMVMLSLSSTIYAQDTGSQGATPGQNDVELIEKGEEAPFDGRLIREPAFNMMWAYMQELEANVQDCREYKKRQKDLNKQCIENLDRAIGEMEQQEQQKSKISWTEFFIGGSLGVTVGVIAGFLVGFHLSGG